MWRVKKPVCRQSHRGGSVAVETPGGHAWAAAASWATANSCSERTLFSLQAEPSGRSGGGRSSRGRSSRGRMRPGGWAMWRTLSMVLQDLSR